MNFWNRTIFSTVVVFGLTSGQWCFGKLNQSSPGKTPGPDTITVLGTLAIVALPVAVASTESKGPNKMFISNVPTMPSAMRAYILSTPGAVQKVSEFIAAVKPYYRIGFPYQGETASGRFLNSLTVLCQILENGPMTEWEALKIPREVASNQLEPDQKLTVSEALAIAIADLNVLAKEVYLQAPQLLESPSPFVAFARETLADLQRAQREIATPKF